MVYVSMSKFGFMKVVLPQQDQLVWGISLQNSKFMFMSAVFLALDYLSNHRWSCKMLFLAGFPPFAHSSPNHGCTKSHVLLRV